MDTLLTLVIAVGGIATGIGVIWTSLATRRQAQLTERSLAEHNERLSLNLEVDLLHRMQDRYDSQLFMGRGRAVARYFLDNAFVDDDMMEVERLNEAATARGQRGFRLAGRRPIFEGGGYPLRKP